ncbi:hypothetical protein CK203_094127 [Vitis vinifera]|uniref:Reverse transcriptase domain-containing protein n=1 Tax=Vitis vinifera TaxID=29760 RepID=A0A438CXR1_VITVI|nr:hypothetical protein CK203_094127 [Vitis vinifera]
MRDTMRRSVVAGILGVTKRSNDKIRGTEGAFGTPERQAVRNEPEEKWEESSLAKFSHFLGFPTEGLEKEILKRLGIGQRELNCGCPMKLKVMSWNVRGANDSSKRKIIKAFTRNQRVDLLCIQETKIQSMSEGIVRSLGSGRFLDWKALNAEGASGGILICWDKRSLDILDWEEGHFTLSCRFRNVENGAVWVFTGVYGLFSKVERDELWEEFGPIRGLWEDPWCLGGDFNITLFQREKSNQRRINSAMRRFAEIVDDLGLVDLPLQGGEFTWNGGHNNQVWARLDIFLVSPSWLDQFSGVTQSRLPWPISDHFPIILVGGGIRRGSTPFRFENMWLKVEGFKDLIHSWWQGIEVRGSTSFKLAAKMKEIKQKLKVWNREIFGRLDCNKSSALQQVDFWDRMESERSLTMEETKLKKEAKENYKKIKINGEWLSEEQEVREGIANAFHQLLSEDTGWKVDIGRLQLDQISQQEAENLESLFTEDEDILEMFKEFHEYSSFLKSLNNTFLVLIPKKSGAEDLGDFRSISLLGGLYKLLAKVLAIRLKKVVGKVVSTSQNAFVMGRQILDALIANEVLRKMGFGSKWLGWMWSCLSSAKFSVLVNGVPASFFPTTKGLRQGDPLSPYLFVKGMEVLDVLIRRAVEGGFLLGCNIRDDSRSSLNISILFFVNDTIVFCEASKEHLTHLSWILYWFEAASGLRINLAKSEIIPVGEVEKIEELAIELGCKVGSLPSQYLGLPLGAPNRAPYMWDGVEERVRRRLALWKRQYISKGGRVTLIKNKEKGGLGLRKLAMLNKALLGKWIWRYACDKDNLWKQVITVKYGQEGLGWRPKKTNGAVGVGVWKEIWKESDWCWDTMIFRVGKGTKIRFWTDV